MKDRSERKQVERQAREDHAAQVAEAEANQRRQEQQAAIAAQALELRKMVDLARTFRGLPASELSDRPAVQLRNGERVFAVVSDVLLVEPRSTGGHWNGGSHGVSVRVPGTRSMRYRIGATSGRYVPGEQVPTSIDTGTAVVTDQRVVFSGPQYTREWLWSKCVALDHLEQSLYTTIAVSNRQKVSGIAYGSTQATLIRFRFDLALAVATDATGDLAAELEEDLDLLEQTLGIPTEPLTPGSPLPPPPPPGLA